MDGSGPGVTNAPAIKAMQFNNRTTVVRALALPGRFQRAIETMRSDTRHLLDCPQPATQWIPLAVNHDFLTCVRRVAYDGDLSRVFEQGRRVQLAGVRGVYKAFVRVLDTEHVINLGARFYQTVFRGNGRLRVERCDGGVIVRYEDIALPSEEFYEAQRGSLQGLCEASRQMGASVTRVEGGGSATHCTLRIDLP